MPATCLLIIVLIIATYGRGRRLTEYRNYCGPRLVAPLHIYCDIFPSPSEDDISSQQVLIEECCHKPCSLLELILYYCKEPKMKVIENEFSFNEVEHFKRKRKILIADEVRRFNGTSVVESTTIALMDEMEGGENVRRKKHIRKGRRRKTKCRCSRIQKQQKEKLLLTRIVPPAVLGMADYHENEPIIIANSF